jgi:hypothetical protein
VADVWRIAQPRKLDTSRLAHLVNGRRCNYLATSRDWKVNSRPIWLPHKRTPDPCQRVVAAEHVMAS